MRSNVSSATSILAEPDQSSKDWRPQNILDYGNPQSIDREEIPRHLAETRLTADGEQTVSGDRAANRPAGHLCRK